MTVNKVMIIGRLTKDPDLKYTPGKGTAVARITVAVDNGYGENASTDFIPVVIWGKQAENSAQYLTKGSLVAVAGRISTRSYNAGDGTKRYVTEVSADLYGGIKFLSNKKSGETFGQPSNEPGPFAGMNFEEDVMPVDDGDMPF